MGFVRDLGERSRSLAPWSGYPLRLFMPFSKHSLPTSHQLQMEAEILSIESRMLMLRVLHVDLNRTFYAKNRLGSPIQGLCLNC